jgi:23S rRNA (pseudouridine1915-N3)-methyltransferase
MKITLILNGRTDDNFIGDGFSFYVKRLKHYTGMEIIEIPTPKLPPGHEAAMKEKEAELLLKHLQGSDHVVLLDDGGKNYTSPALASWLQARMNTGLKNLVFVVGGPYGFDKTVIARANEKMSLSSLTFTHQMVRLIFAEQLYRAFTILRNEPYHH